MSPATLRINGTNLEADLSGALYEPETATLAVADLHLAKGSSYAERGTLLPPYDVRATLARLAAAIERFAPRRVVCLGDSFHDAGARARLHGEDLAALKRLTAAREWIWIAGNHDPEPPPDVGGRTVTELAAGTIVYRHEAAHAPPPGEVSGHFHPKASCHVRGRRISERCFVTDGRRLVLPAFGAYAGGLDVLDPAIAGLFPKGFEVWMLGARRLHRLVDRRLGLAGRNHS